MGKPKILRRTCKDCGLSHPKVKFVIFEVNGVPYYRRRCNKCYYKRYAKGKFRKYQKQYHEQNYVRRITTNFREAY